MHFGTRMNASTVEVKVQGLSMTKYVKNTISRFVSAISPICIGIFPPDFFRQCIVEQMNWLHFRVKRSEVKVVGWRHCIQSVMLYVHVYTVFQQWLNQILCRIAEFYWLILIIDTHQLVQIHTASDGCNHRSQIAQNIAICVHIFENFVTWHASMSPWMTWTSQAY